MSKKYSYPFTYYIKWVTTFWTDSTLSSCIAELMAVMLSDYGRTDIEVHRYSCPLYKAVK